MEAKEKAEGLVSKFENTMFISHEEAKGCAKIAANELIESFKELSIMESGQVKIDFGHGYWELVLKEIDNI